MRFLEIWKKDPKKILVSIGRNGLLAWLPDDLYLILQYYAHTGKKLNLKKPKTFNEKIQWLKLHDRKSYYTDMVDKYKVRSYIERKIGKDFLIPILGVWDTPDQIDFESLPNQFVLKCNHDSASIILCKDKETFDFEVAKNKLRRHLRMGTYHYGREWPYLNVEKKIIAESFMSDNTQPDGLTDYKIHCFNGVPEVVLVCKDRYSEQGLSEDFFDSNWNHLDVSRPKHRLADIEPLPPKNLSLMLKLAKELSENIPFLRVDFYELNGNVYFGELTFYPASGFELFSPDEWDLKLGEWLTLPLNHSDH